jgi:glycerol-3-phosphate dehydrogenase
MHYDVIIIGGGVIGCAVARELARTRARVLLIDKESEVGFGTSKANSGIIHAGHHADPATVKGQLEWPGNQAWDRMAEELGFSFERIGELTVALDAEQAAALEDLRLQGERKGVTGLEMWDAERVRQAEPNLSTDIVAALHAPTAGVVNPYEACFALAENARANGVEMAYDSPVTGIEVRPDRLRVVTDDAAYEARFVVNAAGLFADEVARMAGADGFDLRARKGEEYLLDKRLRGYVTRLIFPMPTATSKGILIIPTYDGTLMVGPTAHWTDKHDLTTTAEGAEEVFSKVREIAPGISERDCIAEFAGLRAVAESEDFVIGATSVPGFVNAAGIQSPGLTAAPAIAERVVGLLAEQGFEAEPDSAFDPIVPPPIRFASLPPERQAEVAREDPRYARIACRCEIVTEGEVRDAVARGARTLDGIKFRTRAGMGRCQGGFCQLRCMDILSEQRGIPLTSVTKRGPGTWVALPRPEDRS